jgi:hypothetical protein
MATNGSDGRAALNTPRRLAVAIAAAAMLAFAAPSASAQPAAPDKKAAPKRAAAPVTARPANSNKDYSVNYDLGRYNTPVQRNTVDRDRVPPISSEFGRVPIQDSPGSFGLTTTSNVSATRFSDGRPVPGLDRSDRDTEGYVGMSMSVPNLTKSLPFLAPAPSPWNRTE